MSVDYILSGKLKVKYVKKGKLVSKILKKGDSSLAIFLREVVHQEIALTNCNIIEASSPHLNDRVRVEKKFGIDVEKGLPTTLLKDIKKL